MAAPLPAQATRYVAERLNRVAVSPDAGPPARLGHRAERLDRAALSAVKRWRFVPARRGSEAVAGRVIVPIHFNLKTLEG